VGLRRTQRLTHRREIAAVYRKGRPQRGELVTVRVLKTGLPVSRFGFAVGGSVGNAVVRNRVRRRLREIVASLGVAEGWDLMLSARPGAARNHRIALRDSQAWRKSFWCCARPTCGCNFEPEENRIGDCSRSDSWRRLGRHGGGAAPV